MWFHSLRISSAVLIMFLPLVVLMVEADRLCSGASEMLRSQSMNWNTHTHTILLAPPFSPIFRFKHIHHTDLVSLAAPGLFVQQHSQAVGHSQHALGQGALGEQLPTVQTVLQSRGLGSVFPWKPPVPDAEQERHVVISPGNDGCSKDLEQEVCGLQRGRDLTMSTRIWLWHKQNKKQTQQH